MAPAAATSSPATAPTPRPRRPLTGFYLIEAADLDEALRIAADIPAAWDGAVEVRPIIDFG
ncbi:YciI family protein [Mycobacterium shinjukuense]|uniref:YciI family protein n=1 Tax=Mycobacterium shinjukuense TaxID=398694 RepID=UPI003BF7F283